LPTGKNKGSNTTATQDVKRTESRQKKGKKDQRPLVGLLLIEVGEKVNARTKSGGKIKQIFSLAKKG